MKIPLPIRTSAWKIFGSVIIFLLFTSKLYSQAPANDICANAVTLTSGTSCSNTGGTVVNATLTAGDPGVCTGTVKYDVWYKFTAATTNPTITLSASGTNSTNFLNPGVQILSGACGSLVSLSCSPAGSLPVALTASGLTIGTTYYVRIYSTSATAAPTTKGLFNLCITDPTTATVDYGKSYVNVSKGTNGGTVQPGDTLEVRATFVVKANTAYNCSFTDNIPANTTYLAGTLNILTNEGKIYKHFTDATGDDAGSISGSTVTINMGSGATSAAGGSVVNTAKPSFYLGTCIMVASYRVVVNPALAYGTKIGVGKGTLNYSITNGGTVLPTTFPTDTIMVYPNYGICSNTVGTNAITSEFGGTFGSGKAKNRYASSKVPSNYTDTIFTSNSPNDYYYGISNNTSTNGAGYSTVNTWAYPDGSSPTHRVFSVEDIVGDHTGASNPLLGNPPADTVNSSTGGYMAFINSAYRTDIAFLDTIYNLCPNTYYQYAAWFRNMCPKCGCDSNGKGASGGAGYIPTAPGDSSGVYPNLTFNVNGYDYYTTGNILHTGKWIQKGFTYLTGPSQTTMIIYVRNNAPGGGGNDWVIDDIGVATCAPNIALTPNKPDTLCMGADDTVRFKVSSFFNNYTQYLLQKSTDGGATWTSPGVDTTGAADNGTGVPVYNSGTGNYEYTVTRYYRLNLTDTLTTYRLIAATTVSNLSNSNCSSYATAQKIVVSVNCMLILPTNIILFKGNLNNGFGSLQWVTTNETANITYTVERSYDQLHFEPVASFAGTAPEGLGATYNFTDPKAIQQPTYYRIHLVSGKYEKYSSIVLLSNTDIDFNVQAVTNPFNDWLAFDVTAPEDAVSSFTIFDTYGRVVKQERQSIAKGFNSIKMYNLGSLASGTYTLQVQYNDRVLSKRIIKLFTN